MIWQEMTTPAPPPSASLSWWPTDEQILLLRAALYDGDAALQAWERWRVAADLQRFDDGLWRLFPLLWDNLNRLGVQGPDVEYFRRVYLKTWVENRQRFRRGFAIVAELEAAGITTVLLKGVALAALYYKDPALRPMGDFDLLVRLEAWERAAVLITAHGLRPYAVPPTRLPYIHGLGFDGPEQSIDLHWSAMAESSYPGGSDPFWAKTVPVVVDGVATRTLDPADQLLHVVTHGARRAPLSPLRWIPDSITVIRSAPALDWGRLAELAAYYRVSVMTERQLSYLKDAFAAPIPAEALAALRRVTPAWYERADFYGRQQTWQSLSMHAFNFLRIRERRRPRLGLLAYLRDWWGLKSAWNVPLEAIRFTAATLRRSKTPSDG